MYNAAGQLNKDQLVQRFAPLVKRIACHLMARLPASVHIDDLVQNGMLGLLDALGRFEAGLGAQFEAYAAQRVRGAMLDGLRENDWLPRSLRRNCRRIEAAITQLEQASGRAPTESELADTLGMSLAEYQEMLQDVRGHQLVYIEDIVAERGEDFLERHLVDESADPAQLIADADLRLRLVQAIGLLPEREQLMMALYYEQDLNLREIGEVMGVSESRVCQLHSQTVLRLRCRLFADGTRNTRVKVERRG
ncbi:MAG TPA: RNA polymerase sigma factor FliA [Candidatus Accumulibacter phosphatis]|mgnify:FL=1|nr:MAG: Sigma-F factor [Candidatus Accumulibacter sp. SK-11]HRL74817.1 RNA polymerase sigma factor FliA [Candidatus Accumulibacter phosphatis]HRQ95016.1 RNA polymerase sigma factor FliA [Candidatus Accumulibacter phosphatis]